MQAFKDRSARRSKKRKLAQSQNVDTIIENTYTPDATDRSDFGSSDFIPPKKIWKASSSPRTPAKRRRSARVNKNATISQSGQVKKNQSSKKKSAQNFNHDAKDDFHMLYVAPV